MRIISTAQEIDVPYEIIVLHVCKSKTDENEFQLRSKYYGNDIVLAVSSDYNKLLRLINKIHKEYTSGADIVYLSDLM